MKINLLYVYKMIFFFNLLYIFFSLNLNNKSPDLYHILLLKHALLSQVTLSSFV